MAKGKKGTYRPIINSNIVSHNRNTKDQIHQNGPITGETNAKKEILKGPNPKSETFTKKVLEEKKLSTDNNKQQMNYREDIKRRKAEVMQKREEQKKIPQTEKQQTKAPEKNQLSKDR